MLPIVRTGGFLMFGAMAVASNGASAQSLFCPRVGPGPSTAPYVAQSGACTNGVTESGAFSGAAVGSQALSDLSQSSTAETNRAAVDAISRRRTEEVQRCAAGLIRTSSGCERPRAMSESPAPQRQSRRSKRRGMAAVPQDRGPIVRKGVEPTIIVPIDPMGLEPVRFGAFAQGFGDFEQRTGRATASVGYAPGGSNFTNLPVDIYQKANTRTGGFLGGIDMTSRNVFSAGDGLIFGLIGGYTDSSIDITTTTSFRNPVVLGLSLVPGQTTTTANVPSGYSRTKVSVAGPSAGAFMTYFINGFSFDQTVKADFYSLGQTFNETLSAVGAVTLFGLNGLFNNAGAARADLTQISAIGNVGYRFRLTDSLWWEPTAGYQYTRSYYDGGAAVMGLKDGDLVRVQGGARIGHDMNWGTTRIVTSLTGLAYENVQINGGFIQSGAFGSNTLALNDQGKLRGQGILTVSVDTGTGLSGFVQGDVRGGDRYFGAGVRGGLRYTW